MLQHVAVCCSVLQWDAQFILKEILILSVVMLHRVSSHVLHDSFLCVNGRRPRFYKLLIKIGEAFIKMHRFAVRECFSCANGGGGLVLEIDVSNGYNQDHQPSNPTPRYACMCYIYLYTRNMYMHVCEFCSKRRMKRRRQSRGPDGFCVYMCVYLRRGLRVHVRMHACLHVCVRV